MKKMFSILVLTLWLSVNAQQQSTVTPTTTTNTSVSVQSHVSKPVVNKDTSTVGKPLPILSTPSTTVDTGKNKNVEVRQSNTPEPVSPYEKEKSVIPWGLIAIIVSVVVLLVLISYKESVEEGNSSSDLPNEIVHEEEVEDNNQSKEK